MPFDWHVYLSETAAEISPASLFEHVSRSMEPLIHKGQTVEAVSRHFVDDSESSDLDWWPAEVVSVSRYLILFKWCLPDVSSSLFQSVGSEDHPANPTTGGFWFDARGSNWYMIRPVGSSQCLGHSWSPPSHLSIEHGIHVNSDDPWITSLKQRAVPPVFFQQRAVYTYEAIRLGGYVECEHECDPGHVWPVKVHSNVGGRITLSWFGTSGRSRTDERSCTKSFFTLFYLHRRIHPLGWGKYYGLTYSPPPDLSPDRTISNVDAFIRGARSAFSYLVGDERFVNPQKISPGHSLYHCDPPLHEFKVGWKVEAVNPKKPFVIQPATISKVFNARYFLIELDDLRNPVKSVTQECSSESIHERISFVSHAGDSMIMPANSSHLRGFNLVPPFGWPSKKTFTWTNYLVFLANCLGLMHSQGLENGMLRPPMNSGALPSPNHVHSLPSPTVPCSDLVNNLVNDLSAEKLSISSLSSLYCPLESTFKGVQLSDLLSTSRDADSHNSNAHLENGPVTSVNYSKADTDDTTVKSITERPGQSSNTCRFLLGMKLEMVVPDVYLSKHSGLWSDVGPKLCTATVTRAEGSHMLWLLPDLPESLYHGMLNPVIIDSRSTDVYPVGWADSTGHPLVAPSGYEECSAGAEEAASAKTWDIRIRPTHDLQIQTISYSAEEICPPVYINTKCYLGPFICRASLDLVPRCFGPGPTSRVMHNLLTRLVGAAYRPLRVLRMFEADWVSGIASAAVGLRNAQRNSVTQREGVSLARTRVNVNTAQAAFAEAETEVVEQRRSGMRVVIVRIRCPRRGVKIDAPVEVCCRARAVEEFCRQISLVLEACPYLISTKPASQTDSTAAIQSDHDNRYGECPSFCCSRLRSRNTERQPSWRRKLCATMRSFTDSSLPADESHSSVPRNGTIPSFNLRTRSAVAAAQQPGSARQLQVLHHPPTRNGFPVGRTARRPGRVSKKLRGPPIGQPTVESQSTTHHTGNVYASNGTEVDTHSQKSQRTTEHDASLHSPYAQSHNLWFNYNHPYLNSAVYASHRYRAAHRPNTTNRYTQDPNLGSSLSDVPHVTLSSNPLFWSPIDLASYLGETDCREMWPWLAAEAVDGQAFMLLTLPVLHHLVGLQWEDAVRLARHVASVRRAFMEQYNGAALEDRNACSRAS